MALTRFKKRKAKDLLRNPFPEHTNRGMRYSLYGGQVSHSERNRFYRKRWKTVTLPRELVDRLAVVARDEGFDLSPWLSAALSIWLDRLSAVRGPEGEELVFDRGGRKV